MTGGLKRFHESGQSHFLTFSCYQRQRKFASPDTYNLFLECLERMRLRFKMRIYGYVVMPEHVHLLVSEPETLSDAMHFLKLSFTKRLRHTGSFWQKRYYDRNVRDAAEFDEKLGYPSQSGEEGPGKRTRRVGMEQLSSLLPARSRDG
jgi:putative transposase